MASCPDQELFLGGLVDGELDAANTALAEAHIARCEGCREEVERLQGTRNLLRADGVRHRAPESLTQRLVTLPEISEKLPRGHLLPGWLVPGVTGALAASLALVTLVPLTNSTGVDEQLVSSHIRSLQPGHLTDVQTTNQHIVKPWFNGRIDFAPPVPELASSGFPLAGGRLDAIEGKTVAAIVYHRRLHTINLFVWRGDDKIPAEAVEDGFSLTGWSEGGLTFAAVSDIPPQELRQFEDLYRRASK